MYSQLTIDKKDLWRHFVIISTCNKYQQKHALPSVNKINMLIQTKACEIPNIHMLLVITATRTPSRAVEILTNAICPEEINTRIQGINSWWSVLHVHPIWCYLSSWSYTGVENSPHKCLVIKLNYFKTKIIWNYYERCK